MPDVFTEAYIRAALFSETDSEGDALDANHDVHSIHPDTLAKMQRDCAAFQEAHSGTTDDESQAGHDFWLTRNGHGAGFWDGAWPEPLATELTNAARYFGECYLYIGDDGLIHSL